MEYSNNHKNKHQADRSPDVDFTHVGLISLEKNTKNQIQKRQQRISKDKSDNPEDFCPKTPPEQWEKFPLQQTMNQQYRPKNELPPPGDIKPYNHFRTPNKIQTDIQITSANMIVATAGEVFLKNIPPASFGGNIKVAPNVFRTSSDDKIEVFSFARSKVGMSSTTSNHFPRRSLCFPDFFAFFGS